MDKELCELIVQAVGKLEPEDRAAQVVINKKVVPTSGGIYV